MDRSPPDLTFRCVVAAVEPGSPPLDGRLIQCFLYTRTPGMAQDNHYAHPLDMVVNLDMNTRKVPSLAPASAAIRMR